MHYGLAGGRTIVNADIKAVRVAFFLQELAHLCQKAEHCHLLFLGGLKEGGYVPLRDDQRVAGGNGEAIVDGDCMSIAQYYIESVKVAEWAFGFIDNFHRYCLMRGLTTPLLFRRLSSGSQPAWGVRRQSVHAI